MGSTPEPKNTRMWLYIGAVSVLLLAGFFSARTKPSDKAKDKDTPPQPLVQDTTADSAQQLKHDIDANKKQQEQDTVNGVPAGQYGQPGHLMVTGFDAAGKPIYGLPAGPGQPDYPYGAQPSGQPGQQTQPPPPTAEETAAQQLAADERKRADQARFASNIAYSRSAEQQAAQQRQVQENAQNPPQTSPNSYSGQFQPAAAPASPLRSRDEIPATDYKRPAEVNVNAAVGLVWLLRQSISFRGPTISKPETPRHGHRTR